MNGDSYSSRGMAPSSSSAKPKQQGGASTDKQVSTDSGRHGSSRDYPVSNFFITYENMI
jgi:splicing factor U2AF subunit